MGDPGPPESFVDRHLVWIMAWMSLCFIVSIHNEVDFHALAMVCLAAVVTKSKSLN